MHGKESSITQQVVTKWASISLAASIINLRIDVNLLFAADAMTARNTAGDFATGQCESGS
jgi:hypothetical protein